MKVRVDALYADLDVIKSSCISSINNIKSTVYYKYLLGIVV